MDLNGSGAGTGYVRISTGGTINLSNATLDLTVSPNLTAGETFTIINNTGLSSVTGQFKNGTSISAINNPLDVFTINTAGGDGNDVVATLATSSVGTVDLLDVSNNQIVVDSNISINSNLSVQTSGTNITFGLLNTSSAFIAAFDSDGNGQIDSNDLGRFGQNFGLTI